MKLYRVFSFIKLPDVQILEKLNKALSRKFPRLKSADFFTILYGIYRVFPQELLRKPENKAFIAKIIEEIEKKSTFDALNLKQLNQFLEVLTSQKFDFFNKNLFIEAILNKQLYNYSQILKSKLKANEEKVINLPYFSNFLKNISEIPCNSQEILNFLVFIKENNAILSANELLNVLYFLVKNPEKNSQKPGISQLSSKTPQILEISLYFSQLLSKSNLHQIHQENLPILYKTLVFCEFLPQRTLEEIVRRSFGFLFNSIAKFSDFTLSKTLVFLGVLSRSLGEKFSSDLQESLVKALQRFVLRNEYHSFEEIEEIRALRESQSKKSGVSKISRVSSFSFVKDGLSENYKLLIKRHTQLINSFWFLSTFYLQQLKGLLGNSLIWKEFAVSLNNVGVKDLFTIDNIQKLEEIQKFSQIHQKMNTEIFFKNREFAEIFIQQEEFLKKNFAEKKKKLRISIKNRLDKVFESKGLSEKFGIEAEKIYKGFPVDIVIFKKNQEEAGKVAIVLANIYEERNEGLLYDKEAYREYFRMREFTLKNQFAEVFFIVKELQLDSLLEEILAKIQ